MNLISHCKTIEKGIIERLEIIKTCVPEKANYELHIVILEKLEPRRIKKETFFVRPTTRFKH